MIILFSANPANLIVTLRKIQHVSENTRSICKRRVEYYLMEIMWKRLD